MEENKNNTQKQPEQKKKKKIFKMKEITERANAEIRIK